MARRTDVFGIWLYSGLDKEKAWMIFERFPEEGKYIYTIFE